MMYLMTLLLLFVCAVMLLIALAISFKCMQQPSLLVARDVSNSDIRWSFVCTYPSGRRQNSLSCAALAGYQDPVPIRMRGPHLSPTIKFIERAV